MDPLIGAVLDGGWSIKERRSRLPDASGGYRSLCYVATHSSQGTAFVKLIDPAIDLTADDPLADLRLRLDTFGYEQAIAKRCGAMSRVVQVIGQGKLAVPGSPAPFFYIIFEQADCDLREQVELSKRFDRAFRLRVLHHAAVGLSQLHAAQIAHQDVKPSNVLVFPGDEAKLGDLGHAHDRAARRPGADSVLAADPTYAPPEQLYGFRLDEWGSRRLSADLYLLGSIATFLFTGVGTTPLLGGHLRPQHHWHVWTGSFEDALPYVREAWDAVMEDLRAAIDSTESDELVRLARYLTEPDPLRRGFPENQEGRGMQYGLERFVSRLDVLASREERDFRSGRIS
jgi:eukaryotic-like serine/threonine-protein kinase